MELTQLRGFLEVARTRSFTRAAEKLFLTQPALSLQVKALEEALGEALFERQGKQLLLTSAGRILLERSEQVLALVEQTEQEISALQGLQAGRLTIGTTESNCLYLLPDLIHFFREKFPNIELRFVNRPSAEVALLVVEGRVDFGLATLPILDPRLKTETLVWREDVAVCSPQHPLSQNYAVGLPELVQHPLILPEKSSHSRLLLDQMLAKAGLIPRTVMELSGLEVIKRFIELDLGVSILPGFTLEKELKAGRLHAIRLDWLPTRAIGLIKRRKGYLSPAGQMFLKLLKNRLPEVLLCPL